VFDWKPVLYVIGHLLLVLAGGMVFPALVDAAEGNRDWQNFAASVAITCAAGAILIASSHAPRIRLDRRQGFVLTTLAWVAMSGFGALPFLFSDVVSGYPNAFFEAVSGFTTTGSTIMVGLDQMPPGILLWRSILQWLGGIGIIAMAVAMLPFLGVGGMQLFRMESSDRSDKAVPRARQLAASLFAIYVAASALCALAYWALGMTFFEAVCHAMTTIATGGYSTTDSSFGKFDSPALHWTATLFMLVGAFPFVLYLNALRGRPGELFGNAQVRGYIILVGCAVLAAALWIWLTRDIALPKALTLAAFNVVSVVTTTGYASADYMEWGNFAIMLFLVLTFIGGCAGSTSGGIKYYRLHILADYVIKRIRQLPYPSSVSPSSYDGRPLSPDIRLAIATFFFLYVVTVGAIAFLLALFEIDFLTSLSAAATAVGNVGPGLGPIIGPAGNFASLPDAVKWILSFGMLLGRLELFTVIVLFSRAFWRS